MAFVSIQNLSKTYPAPFPRLKRFLRLAVKPPVVALKNVSFDIAEGEIFGLIGRNGAGKTTLTKIIATLVQPSGGRVLINNFDSVKDEVKVRSLIGLATAEERSFYWRLTAEQNLLFFMRLYGMQDKPARRRIAEIFEQLDLTALSKRLFSELSTGNKQRLAVARALLPAPPVLLLDEPTRSLDPMAAAKMRELILSLKNVSVLLTSHNLSEIEKLCRRVAIISEGEIRALDTAAELRRQHKQIQRVRIIVNGLPEDFGESFPLKLPKLEIETRMAAHMTSLSFTREAGDEALNETLLFLMRTGARVLDIETENPTLEDVLESYE